MVGLGCSLNLHSDVIQKMQHFLSKQPGGAVRPNSIPEVQYQEEIQEDTEILKTVQGFKQQDKPNEAREWKI